MYIEKLNTQPQTLKEISFKDFKTKIGLDAKIGLYKNILQDLHYTNIYIKEGQVKQYIFKYKGLFYKVPMSEQEFEQLTQKYNEIIDKQQVHALNGAKHPLNKYSPTISDIMFLYQRLGNSIEIEPQVKPNGNDKYITKRDILDLVKNITILEKEINNRNLRNNQFELIKYIHNYYKMNTNYWISDGYGYSSTRFLDLTQENSTANHPYSYLGLINERYATCQGMAQALAQLYNYFGIKSDIAKNDWHSVTRVYLNDNRVTYIDLAKEISPYWKDSLYEGWNRRSAPIQCTNPNAYNWFCKDRIGFAQIDNETNVPITLCDNFGRLQVPLIDEEKTIRSGFEVKAVHQPPTIPGFKVKR